MPEQTFDTFVRPPPDLHKAASFFTWVTSKAPEKLASRKFAHRKLAEDYAPPAQGEEETALIGGFNQPLPQVLETILAMIENELKTALAYQVYAQTLHGLVRGDIAEEFLEHADQETEHAQYLMKRYSVLGGGPLNLPDVPAPAGSTDPIDIIQRMMRIEQEGAAKWRLLHSMIDESNPMRFKVEEYMTREEEHQDDLKRYLPPEPMTTPPTSLQAAAPPMAGAPAEGGAPKLASKDEAAREAGTRAAIVGGLFHGLINGVGHHATGSKPVEAVEAAVVNGLVGALGTGVAGYMGAKAKTRAQAMLYGLINPIPGSTLAALYGKDHASSKHASESPAALAGSGGAPPSVPVTSTLAKAAPAKPLGAVSGKPSILGKPILAKSLGEFVKKAAGLDLGNPGDISPSPSMPVQGDNGMSPGLSQSVSPVAGMPGLAEMELQGQKEEDANAALFFQQKAQQQQADLEQAQQQLQELQGQVQEKDQSLQQAQQLAQTQQQAAQMAHDTAARAMAAQVQSMQQVTQSQEQTTQTMQGLESMRQNVLAAVNAPPPGPGAAPAGGGGETAGPGVQDAGPGDPTQASPGTEQSAPIQQGGEKTAAPSMAEIRQGAGQFMEGFKKPFQAAFEKSVAGPARHLAQHPAAIAAPLGLTVYGAVDGYRKAKNPETVEKARAVTQAAAQQKQEQGTFAAALRLVQAQNQERMTEAYAEHPGFGALRGASQGMVAGLAINRAADAGQRVYNRVKGML
jgi:bacterioferritin